MKRVNHLFEKIISKENLERAIVEVNRTHRRLPNHKLNKTVLKIEQNPDQYILELQNYINGLVEGTKQLNRPIQKNRFDKSAGKWRCIHEPRLWPDQYIHHALIQALEPVMMKAMDRFCCGSIRGRGIHYGVKRIKKWMKNDVKGTKYCMDLDIRHFYESISPEAVISRIKQLVKDYKTIKLCECVVSFGILIGVYTSQWFANVLLQPLDQMIHDSGLCKHYLRYMDNFTIFGSNKRKLKKLKSMVESWLFGIGLSLKDNWQVYPTLKRLPQALGYRYGRGYTLLRKRNLMRLKKSVSKYKYKIVRGQIISARLAQAIISRLGQLRHCNHVNIYKMLEIEGMQRKLKCIVKKYFKRILKQQEQNLVFAGQMACA